jgi:hypothetical protein
MLFFLIDHDNVSVHASHLNRCLSGWVSQISREHTVPPVTDVLVRAYGGWWREDQVSDARSSAQQLYSEYCPALIAAEGHYWRVRFEFADGLLLPPGMSDHVPPFHHTVVSRPAQPMSIADAAGPACAEQGCEVQRCRRWLYRRRGCTRNACPQIFGDIWMRTEQKQVDTHLAVDLLQLCKSWPESVHVALVSDDTDFLPVLLASSIGSRKAASLTHVRLAGRESYLDDFLRKTGVRIFVP